ncbi:aquaporin-like protein [Pseudovirgaria hyperparasitica]|uniref:Aquaporin-like protein n=1 Tax=Pseudovirgaria hyperparasitica TaxID=470096 RepID=A0A6A6W729_9PEZI|nr:aquaporin-like protein [Pseudovirgaria hyperparasitica]KAF2758688.1 aquaporin-like protein [Pseudovirgaria hyperparasitica]
MNVSRPSKGIRMPWQSMHIHRHLPDSERAPRLPLSFLPRTAKRYVVACAGEFVGTFMFLLFALGGTNVVNTAPAEGANSADLSANPSKIMFIALCFGMSLAVNAWVFFRITGGLFNPAVTFGMMIIGAMEYAKGGMIIASQILGGIAASAVVSAMMPNVLAVKTELGGGTTVVQGLFIEMFLTAQLVFTIFMLATEKHAGTFIAPVGIGLSLFVAELMGVYYTGGSVNPARSFGPCVVTRDFHSYHWIYWVGPVLGSLLAAAFYTFIKALEFETGDLEPDSEAAVEVPLDRESGGAVAADAGPTPGLMTRSTGTTDVFQKGPELEKA